MLSLPKYSVFLYSSSYSQSKLFVWNNDASFHPSGRLSSNGRPAEKRPSRTLNRKTNLHRRTRSRILDDRPCNETTSRYCPISHLDKAFPWSRLLSPALLRRVFHGYCSYSPPCTTSQTSGPRHVHKRVVASASSAGLLKSF